VSRVLLIATAALLVLGIPVAFGGTQADPGITPTSIHIGGTVPLSGSAQAFQSVAKGADAYFKYVNARGGVNKRKINYEYLDDEYPQVPLLPKDAGARARAVQWLIAALNSVEPHIMNVAMVELFYADEEWAKLRRPGARAFAGSGGTGRPIRPGQRRRS